MESSAESEFGARAGNDRARIEARLADIVSELASQHDGMAEAIGYSLLAVGKRLRPLLCLWTHDALDGTHRDAAIDVGCALECIHTYSLVHDDLPCMDDDDLRRGRPSSHRQFGEATAVLTGDALLTLSFEILAGLRSRDESLDADVVIGTIRILSRAAGTAGLITGQALDLAPPQPHDETLVERIQENKTGRLFSAAMELGALLGGAHEASRRALSSAGALAGGAFQITDDLLDNEKDKETLGKTPGKDIKNGKLTYPSVVGSKEARLRATEQIQDAISLLPPGDGFAAVQSLLLHMVERVA